MSEVSGKIKMIDINAGYGFITHPGRNDVFFHASACADELLPLRDELRNQQVSYEIEQSDRGPRARNVRLAT